MQTVCDSLKLLRPSLQSRKRGRFLPSIFHHGSSQLCLADGTSLASYHSRSLSTQFVLQFPRVRRARRSGHWISSSCNIPPLYVDPDDNSNLGNQQCHSAEESQRTLQHQKEENGKFARNKMVILVSTTGATWSSLHKNRILCPRAYTDDQQLAKFEPILYFDKRMMNRAREILYEYDQEMALNLDPRVLLLGREAVYPTPCSIENEGPPPIYDDFADDDIKGNDDNVDTNSVDSKTTMKTNPQATMNTASRNHDVVDVEEEGKEKVSKPDDSDPPPHQSLGDVVEAIQNNIAVENAKKKSEKQASIDKMKKDHMTNDTILRERLHKITLEEYEALLFLVAERLHFFFSDAVARQHGIIRTRFLMKRDGSIPLDKLLTFRSIRELTDSPKVLVDAAKLHCADELVINEKKDGIRRIVPFTLDKMKDHVPKSLYLFALPHNPKKYRYYTSTEEIRSMFVLTPILVTLRFRDERHPKTGKVIKRIPRGSAIVEFEKVAQMERVAADCLTRVNGKGVIPRRPLLLMPREEEQAKPPRLVHAMKLAEYLKQRENGFYPNDSFRRPAGMHGEYLNAFGSPNMYR